MPKSAQFHASERVDKPDLTVAATTFAREADNLQKNILVLDRHARVVRGFRVELPDQATYPGRIVVHGGAALSPDGQLLFNEDQVNVSRTITLEGSSTTFYVELEFITSDSDLDSRAFWDPTVDQGLDTSGDALPDGQEFSSNVATRKSPDWRVVTPISTTGFARDTDPMSTNVPLIKLSTTATNVIDASVNTGLVTEPAKSVVLQHLSTTQTQVQDAQLFQATEDIILDNGGSNQETVTISAVDLNKRLITHSAAVNSHAPGDLVSVTGASARQFITESPYNLFQHRKFALAATNVIDWKGKYWQGDELHGEALAKDKDDPDRRSDAFLQSQKDHIDFLAAQIQEMKWGAMDPRAGGTADARIPPATVSFPIVSEPRYSERAGSIAGVRTHTVTIGDGTNSWGDFNGTDHTPFVKAYAEADHIFVKKGTYSFTGNVSGNAKTVVANPGEVTINVNSAGKFVVTDSSGSGSLTMKNITLQGVSGGSGTALAAGIHSNADEVTFDLEGVVFQDSQLALDETSSGTGCTEYSRFADCTWQASDTAAILTGYNQIVGFTTGKQLSGFFTRCRFERTGSTGSEDVVGSDVGVWRARFDQCVFKASDDHSVFVTDASSDVHFNGCTFEGSSTASNGVYALSLGGSLGDLFFSNCRGYYQAIKVALTAASSTSSLGITGCHFENSQSTFTTGQLSLTNCQKVSISGNVFDGCGGSAAVHITASASTDLFDYSITGNTFTAVSSGSHPVSAIKFDVGSNTLGSFSGISISGNTMNMFESGIVFRATTSVWSINGLSITGNSFIDEGVSSNESFRQKNGVFIEEHYGVQNVSIVGNTFKNFNCSTNGVLSGQNSTVRAAVVIERASGGVHVNINISDNSISYVEDTTLFAAGVFVESGSYNLSITGNNIYNVISSSTSGDSVFACGVLLGLMLNSSFQLLKVNNNQIDDLAGSSTAHSVGVYIEPIVNDISRVSVSGNHIVHVSTATTGTFAGVRIVNGNGDTDYVSVCNNIMTSGSFASGMDKDGIEIDSGSAAYMIDCSGNQMYLTSGSAKWTWGIIVTSNAGSGLNFNITNNNIYNFDRGILIGDDALNVVISGNNLLSTEASIGIQINDDVDYMTISNNVLRCLKAGSDGIYAFCTAAYNWVISGNVIAIYQDNTNRGIYLSSVNQHVIIGNLIEVLAVGSGTPSAIHTINSTEGSVIGNRWDSVATRNPDATDDDDANYTW